MTRFECRACGTALCSAAEQEHLNDVRCSACAGKAHTAELGAALIDQARLGDAYERSVGTSSEQGAYQRLRQAGRTVRVCDRQVKADRTDALDRRPHVLQHDS